jgi:hypothetical protein
LCRAGAISAGAEGGAGILPAAPPAWLNPFGHGTAAVSS